MSGHSAVTAIVIDTGADDPAGRLAALFDAHQDRLYRLARRLVPTRDDARDLVQEAFLRAAAAPRSVPVGHAGEEAWLVRVLINIRRDQWRRAVVRHRADPLLHASAVAEESSHASAAIARATIWRALDVLHPRRRAVVVMHELDGMTFSAIASLLGISAITARWHLSMGRRELARNSHRRRRRLGADTKGSDQHVGRDRRALHARGSGTDRRGHSRAMIHPPGPKGPGLLTNEFLHAAAAADLGRIHIPF